ncbi:hypothetical protein Lal_00003953 [Lupinus albus]|nr:hypothetical protein Lal_00003953 [Lupinus albus]
MVESHLRWFEHKLLGRVYQIESSMIPRGMKRPRKVIGETIKKNLEIIVLSINITYDKIL